MSSRTIVMGVVLCTAMAAGTLLWAQVSLVDPKLPKYQAVSGIAGNLNSIGSDTMNNLVTLLAEGFKKFYPNVNIQIEDRLVVLQVALAIIRWCIHGISIVCRGT
jgi:phosphate transport system substrate-binding protein